MPKSAIMKEKKGKFSKEFFQERNLDKENGFPQQGNAFHIREYKNFAQGQNSVTI